jgi:hypothetical protein
MPQAMVFSVGMPVNRTVTKGKLSFAGAIVPRRARRAINSDRPVYYVALSESGLRGAIVTVGTPY